jgi:hypothetical protein
VLMPRNVIRVLLDGKHGGVDVGAMSEPGTNKAGTNKAGGPAMAFLVAAFAVVGMTGMIASYIAPLPLQRALARDATLDEALAVAGAPDAQARLEALRPRLDDSAAAILPAGPDLAERITRERAAMHARFLAETDAAGSHLAWMIGIVTLMGAAFGVAMLNFAGRDPARRNEAQNRLKPDVEVSNTRET